MKDNKKDPNYLAKLERAIAQKYGHAAVQNIRKDWTEEKEKEYLNQIKKILYSDKETIKDKVEINGFFVSQYLIKKETNRVCPKCNVYSFKIKDDVYMSKYNCCYKCYIIYIEDR